VCTLHSYALNLSVAYTQHGSCKWAGVSRAIARAFRPLASEFLGGELITARKIYLSGKVAGSGRDNSHNICLATRFWVRGSL
jgi:hypothetical protein